MLQIIALSEQVVEGETLAVNVNGQPIVLFRDIDGSVCALEDRCPHRRVPLSLGKVIKGELRCAYHGWTFSGLTGACTDIPNLSDEETIPAKLKAQSFTVKEQNGFIYLLDSDTSVAEFPAMPFSDQPVDAELSGRVAVPIGLEQYRAVLLDGPENLLAFSGVGITDFYLGGVEDKEQSLSIDRAADWSWRDRKPSWKSFDYPLIIRSEVCKHESSALVSVLNTSEQPLMEVYIVIVQSGRGTSNILWRARRYSACFDSAPLAIRLKLYVFDDFVKVKEAPSAMSINNLIVGPSTALIPVDSVSNPSPSL
jgi:nitrite reductase/ring-hydroxylating ferredoxin subunit